MKPWAVDAHDTLYIIYAVSEDDNTPAMTRHEGCHQKFSIQTHETRPYTRQGLITRGLVQFN